MPKLKRTEDTVREVLKEKPATRIDDFKLLLYAYDRLTEADIMTMPFGEVMIRHEELKLPSFETITRCRRMVQNKQPWLRPTPQDQEGRDAMEREFRAYARS